MSEPRKDDGADPEPKGSEQTRPVEQKEEGRTEKPPFVGSEGAKAAEGAEAGADVAEPAPTAERPDARLRWLKAERRVVDRLLERFGEGPIEGEVTHDHQLHLAVDKAALPEILRFLRDDPELRFELLIDITCADYLKLPELAPRRFGLLYIVYSLALDTYLRMRVYVEADEARVPSAASVFAGANWAEREVYDLYGIVFEGHPDLRRIVMPDFYEGYPLRKDYPLKGRGERDSFPVISRRES